MRNRKRSLVLSITTVFILLYSIFNIVGYTYDFNKYYAKFEKERIKYLVYNIRLAKTLLETKLYEDLGNRLHEARERHEIDFFILKENKYVIFFENADDDLNSINIEFKEFDQVFEWDSFAYAALKVDNLILAVGINKEASTFYWTYLKSNKIELIRDFLFILMTVFFVALYFLWDFLQLSKNLSKGKKIDIKTRSQESENLLRGIHGFHQNIDELSHAKSMLEKLVLPALKSELHSGRKPPYSFTCTLARTDINDFSTILSKFSPNEFMELINDFFVETTKIVSKYGGWIYEFIGDEVIYYFKEEDSINSSIMAMMAIEEINSAASKCNAIAIKNHGYNFFVKSSLSFGQLQFGKQVNSFSLAGRPFIETVRILSHVSEKNCNSIFYPENIKHSIAGVFSSNKEAEVELKGLPGKTQLFSTHSKISAAESLANYKYKNLIYYRSPQDAVDILVFLNQNKGKLKKADFLFLVGFFKNYEWPDTPENLKESYLGLIKGTNNSFFLSALISCAPNIIHIDNFDQATEELFSSFLANKDSRVVANTLDMFCHFNPSIVYTDIHKDSRVQANALIIEAKNKNDPITI